MNVYQRSLTQRVAGVGRVPMFGYVRRRPLKGDAGIDRRDIHAAMRARATEIVVPVAP